MALAIEPINNQPVFTLLQRLEPDTKIGFNYHYMGYAEYEFGSTQRARQALREALDAGTLKRGEIALTDARSHDSINAVVLYIKGAELPLELIADNKGWLGLDAPDTVGWLACRGNPMILLRTRDLIPTAEKFLRSLRAA